MEITITYIISQFFVILNYVFLAITYYSKDRKRILFLNFCSLTSIGIAYIFLSAYTGLSMVILSIIRNIIFLLDEKKFGKTTEISKREIFILILIYIITITFAVFTYNEFLSLLSVFATMLYTFSVWQKKTIIYKALGIPVGLLWLFYNIYISSIFGIILETILLLSVINGWIIEKKKEQISN